MSHVLDSGLAGVSFSPGDHACALYFGAIERDSIAAPFLRAGLQTGEKCLDLAQFGGGIILDLLRTHPKVLLGGTLIDNPNFLTPDEYRATRS